MPRPPKAIRPVEKTVNIPEDIVAKVDLLLWSDLEERVPHGAWARYILGLIQEDMQVRTGKRLTTHTVAKAKGVIEESVTELAELATTVQSAVLNRAIKRLTDFTSTLEHKS